jgi:hypothetical protein
MASTYLTRAMNGNSETVGTISLWLKRAKLGQHVICSFWEDSTTYQRLQFDSSDRLHWIIYDNNNQYGQVISTRKFRDTSSWYHIVSRVDTTQSTAADRVRLYVNGELIDTFDSGTSQPTQNRNVKQSAVPYIGTEGTITSARFDGCMSHIHYTDAASNAPTVFGETDATTGEWKIKTDVSTTYGAKGFFILKDGNSGTDYSGNSNNFTASGNLTNTEDCPSNNFATWNNLQKRQEADKGATEITPNGDADYTYAVSTLGASTGKYYFEFESNSGNGRALLGMVWSDYATSQINDNSEPGGNAYSFAYRQNQGDIQLNNSTSSYGSSLSWGTSGNVLMMAVDLDNNKVWYGVDGTWQNSGDPSNGTNGFDWSAVRVAGQPYLLLAGDDTSSGYGNIQANFGNGYFGTDAISSEGTNASGIGKFRYNVPTNFTALSTKGLNE